MMFDVGESFAYVLCGRCGCLQIAEVPRDMSRHYPPDYCSFKPALERRFANPIRNLFRLPRYRSAVLGKGLWGRLLHAVSPKAKLDVLRPLGLTETSRVLDVGCGTGSLLYKLRAVGFENLLGVDAFIERDIEYPNGLRILKRSIDGVDGTWDCVMFNYSLEHMPDQHAALSTAARLLRGGGTCFVRIPLVSSHAWEHYGVNWVQLDAPRHLYLHSRESFERLTRDAGLEPAEVVYDSDDFQFWGSEQYASGIPLKSERSHSTNPSRSIFSRAEIRTFRKKADELNRESRGDIASFYLRKPQ